MVINKNTKKFGAFTNIGATFPKLQLHRFKGDKVKEGHSFLLGLIKIQ